MIWLGLGDAQKDRVVSQYCAEHGITKVFVLTPERFNPGLSVEHDVVTWPNIIEYRFYYRLLQEIGRDTLVVINECLRTQNRHDLTYNCIRNFLNQAGHVMVFQYLPIIDTIADFMILFDFDTRSRWKREHFNKELLKEAQIEVAPAPVLFRNIPVPVDAKVYAQHAKEKARLLAEVRSNPDKDPHNLPRNMYLVSGKAKLAHIEPGRRYIGRNNRFKLANMETYRDAANIGERTVFEFCHNFIDFADFLNVSKQTAVDVLVADTKADQWYFNRYVQWAERLADAYSAIQ